MKKKKKIKKQINRVAKKNSTKTKSLVKSLNKFFKSKHKKSKYVSVIKTKGSKSTIGKKKAASKSKYVSVLKAKDSAKKTKKETKFEQKRNQQILNDLKKGNFEKLRRQDYLDDKILRSLKKRKQVDYNTARFEAELKDFETRNLSSSWILDGVWEFEDRTRTLTITIVNRLKRGMLKKYKYTYKVKDEKVWEEMKAAKGAYGSGAGTVFWEYFKKGLIVVDNSLR